MVERDQANDWLARPWIMAAVGALGGFLFHLLVDDLSFTTPLEAETLWRMASATLVAVATLSFIVIAERQRLSWAIAFALAWGVVMALVGYFTASYDRNGEVGGFPFLSGLLAVVVAAPLFQTVRDEGRRSLPYERVHRYAWTDAIIGGASIAFTGLTFLLAFLLASLFDAIGISLLKDLLNDEWFAWMLAGAAFGAASGVLRERDALLGTLQKLVMVVFSVLAPVLAAALAIYLLALPVTGTAGLWKSGLPETPLLLSAAAFSVVMLNAIIGDSPNDRGKGVMWRLTEGVLLVAVLPLGALALVSMSMRVNQYGWSPERLWGVIACAVAIAYGVAAWAAWLRKRRDFDVPLRESQKHLALGLCGLALFLALPIVDFGAISARSQIDRLEAGKVNPSEFDYTALAFDFGPAGRKQLERLRTRGTPEVKSLAAAALQAKDRWRVDATTRIAAREIGLEKRLRLVPPDIALTPDLRHTIANRGSCDDQLQCVLVRIDQNRLMLLTGGARRRAVGSQVIDLRSLDKADGSLEVGPAIESPSAPEVDDITRSTIEVRPVERRQVFVDGKPVGQPFE